MFEKQIQQVVDNIAYRLALILFDDEVGVFALGKNHPEHGQTIRSLDKIAELASITYQISQDELMDRAMEQVDERLAILHLHWAVCG